MGSSCCIFLFHFFVNFHFFFFFLMLCMAVLFQFFSVLLIIVGDEVQGCNSLKRSIFICFFKICIFLQRQSYLHHIIYHSSVCYLLKTINSSHILERIISCQICLIKLLFFFCLCIFLAVNITTSLMYVFIFYFLFSEDKMINCIGFTLRMNHGLLD